MQRPISQFLNGALLATYAGIALIGQGLHLLAPECDVHHHEYCLAAHEVADHDGHQHSSSCGNTANQDHSIADSHPCEICVFLAHFVSQPPQIAAVSNTQPFVTAAHCERQGLNSLANLGLHVARGPPQHRA